MHLTVGRGYKNTFLDFTWFNHVFHTESEFQAHFGVSFTVSLLPQTLISENAKIINLISKPYSDYFQNHIQTRGSNRLGNVPNT